MQDSEDPEAAAGLLQREGAEQEHQPGRGRRLRGSCSGIELQYSDLCRRLTQSRPW
jgi:hypothetical protein